MAPSAASAVTSTSISCSRLTGGCRLHASATRTSHARRTPLLRSSSVSSLRSFAVGCGASDTKRTRHLPQVPFHRRAHPHNILLLSDASAASLPSRPIRRKFYHFFCILNVHPVIPPRVMACSPRLPASPALPVPPPRSGISGSLSGKKCRSAKAECNPAVHALVHQFQHPGKIAYTRVCSCSPPQRNLRNLPGL